MLKLLFKFVLFGLGLVAILDGALPAAEQAMQVDGHHSSQDRRTHDTDYRVDLVGGNTGSCQVGYQAYQTLRDGDRVTVTTSRAVKQCASIARDGVVVHERHYWRLWSLLFGAVFIGSALGILRSADDEE
jgi:hypothetical protein